MIECLCEQRQISALLPFLHETKPTARRKMLCDWLFAEVQTGDRPISVGVRNRCGIHWQQSCDRLEKYSKQNRNCEKVTHSIRAFGVEIEHVYEIYLRTYGNGRPIRRPT